MSVKFRRLLLILVTITAGLLPAFPQPPDKEWQEAKTINANFKAVSSQPDIDVFSAPNIIMLKVNRSTDVRVFTILGKLLSNQHLEPGIFQLHLESHGIYLIKTDQSSCKIAI